MMVSSKSAGEVTRTLEASFQRVEQARRYRSWVMDQLRPTLGQRVLEVGCGVGNFTADLLDRQRVVALDPSRPFLEELGRRLGAPRNLRTLALALEDEQLAQVISEEALDSALLLNVLEHIDDDSAALRNLARALRPSSTVALQVPAHSWLYGETDRALGHRRRYSPGRLARALEAGGLTTERIWQFNALGVVGWFVSGRLRRQPMFSPRALGVYEAIVPLWRAIEPARGVPLGLSLLAVARTPA